MALARAEAMLTSLSTYVQHTDTQCYTGSPATAPCVKTNKLSLYLSISIYLSIISIYLTLLCVIEHPYPHRMTACVELHTTNLQLQTQDMIGLTSGDSGTGAETEEVRKVGEH